MKPTLQFRKDEKLLCPGWKINEFEMFSVRTLEIFRNTSFFIPYSPCVLALVFH